MFTQTPDIYLTLLIKQWAFRQTQLELLPSLGSVKGPKKAFETPSILDSLGELFR